MPTATLETPSDEDEWIWESFRYHSRTFSLATRLLPRSVQMPVATLYLFCRRVDSIADQRVLEIGRTRAIEEVYRLRDRLHKTLAGQPPADDVLWQRLATVHESYTLKRKPLEELIDGALWDLEERPVETTDDLVAYSNLVGGSVGAMMLPFLSVYADTDGLEPSARELGIAMQITNIVRDVGEDISDLNRVYLPTTWLEDHAISRSTLANGRRPSGYASLLERAMSTAEERYRASTDGVAALPVRVRIGIGAAARMYREILNEVRANEYDNLNRRAYVSFGRKLLLIAYDNYDARKARLSV